MTLIELTEKSYFYSEIKSRPMSKRNLVCNFIYLLHLLLVFSTVQAQTKQYNKQVGYESYPAYKAMMTDNTVNFYTVCDSAEAYFKRIDRTVKGSGYKPFVRWKEENEVKYAPSGNRMVDHYMPYKEYLRIKSEGINQKQAQSNQIANWQSLGPDTIGNITGHYAAGLGRVEYVEVNKANQQQIYIGSRSGGLWRTNDGGATWLHHTDFLPASGVNAMAASPTNFDSLLINVRMGGNGYSFGIYRSTDGGITFTETAFNPTNLGFGGLGSDFRINVIKYHPNVPNLVFVGTNKGIFRSTDNLATWVRTNNSWDVQDIEFHPTNNNIVYLYENYYWGSNKNKIQKSTNQGVGYTALNNLSGNDNAEINISVSPTCPNCIFAISDDGIWKSTDSGSTFTTTLNPAPDGISLWYGVPNDLDTGKVVAGYVDLFRSTNGGNTFTQATWWSLGSSQHGGSGNQTAYNNSNVYVHADCNYLTCVNGVFYACTDGFLCKSTDNGLTWQKLSLSTGIRENYNLGLSQSNHYRTICGSQDNGTSIQTENGWIEYTGADGMEGIIHPLNDNWMIGSWQYGSRRRTFDGGLTNNGCTPPGQDGNWIAPMFYDPNNHMTLYSLGIQVHKSADFGNNWVNLGTPSTFGNETIEFASIAENNSNIIAVTRDEKIELSTDGGLTFNSIKNGLPDFDITDVVFDPKNDATILVTYSNYQNNNQKVFITYNSGASWQNITYNIGNMPIRCAIIDHTPQGNIYLGAENGLYKKPMTGTSWALYNPNLPNVTVRELEINYGSNTIKAATWGRGLWEYKLADRNTYPSIIHTSISSVPTLDQPRASVDQLVTSQIEYNGTLTDVFVKWSADAPAFTNTIPMSNQSGNTWQTIFPFPEFPSGTKMYFKVFAIGEDADTTETYKFMYELKPHEYCAASGESENGNLYISNFYCAGMSNTATVNNAYTYYPNKTIVMYKDSTYTATANFNTSWSSNDLIIWVDYNSDLEFNPSERVVLDLNTGSNGSGSFTIPSTAVETNTLRMRVRLGYWGNYGTACGTTLGEVEDYPVIIRSAPAIAFTGSTAFCSGESLNFAYSGTAVDSVKWTLNSGNGNIVFTGSSLNTNTLLPSTYSVLITAYKYGEPFHKSYPSFLTIHALPTANAGTDQTICTGMSVTLNGSGSGSLSWNNGVQNGIAFTPANTNTYQLTVTNAQNCTNTASVVVSVAPTPTALINPLTSSISCYIPNVDLMASGGDSYLWDDNSTDANRTVSNSGTYSVTVTAANGCTDSASATVHNTPSIALEVKALLGGAYDMAQGIMRNYLRQNNLLPLTPPYNQAPWHLPCAESFAQNNDLPADMVDYVVIEARNADAPQTPAVVLCGILHQNGNISGIYPNGSACQTGFIETSLLQPNQSYYFIVRHRNHIALLTAEPVQATQGAVIDFRLPSNVADGVNQLLNIEGTEMGTMIPADFYADGIQSIADFNLYFTQSSLPPGYYPSDCNLDGQVNLTDFNLYQLYRTRIGVSMVRY